MRSGLLAMTNEVAEIPLSLSVMVCACVIPERIIVDSFIVPMTRERERDTRWVLYYVLRVYARERKRKRREPHVYKNSIWTGLSADDSLLIIAICTWALTNLPCE